MKPSRTNGPILPVGVWLVQNLATLGKDITHEDTGIDVGLTSVFISGQPRSYIGHYCLEAVWLNSVRAKYLRYVM